MTASPERNRQPVAAVAVFVASATATVVGMLLPWENNGGRSSFSLLAVLDRLGVLDNVPAAPVVAGLWPFLPLMLAAASAAVLAGYRASGGVIGAVAAVPAVALGALVVTRSGVGTAGPAMCLTGSVLTAASGLVLAVTSRRRGIAGKHNDQ